jgi:replicative DNA helicase
MMRTALLAATTLGLAATALPALAQADFGIDAEQAIYDSIETLHGDADGFDQIFADIQDALAAEDIAAFAALAEYPLAVSANGEVYDIIDAEDLVTYFDTVVLDSTYQAVLAQDYADLIVTGDGVGFADGALWVTNICTDDSCAETYWAIIAINN